MSLAALFAWLHHGRRRPSLGHESETSPASPDLPALADNGQGW